MSRVLLVLCHPSPDSLNTATAYTVKKQLEAAGVTVDFLDLYAEEGFDPVLTPQELSRRFSFDPKVQRYEKMVSDTDLFVFIHPDWWGNMPALLKGWIERVFRPGVAYDFDGPEFGEKSRIPLLSGKSAIVAITSDQHIPETGHPLTALWEQHVFEFCGIRNYRSFILPDVRHTTYRQRKRWMNDVAQACMQAGTQ